MKSRTRLFLGQLAFPVLCLLLIAPLNGCAFWSPPAPAPLPSIRAHKIVRTAYAQMGKKYRPGGASPQKGFDCSGLVWWAYKQHGIKIPRITKDQAKTGKAVSRKMAKAGDIVVFRTGRGPQGLHTGLYAGDGCFIHSPRPGKKVCIDKLSLPHWKNTLISIRRIDP